MSPLYLLSIFWRLIFLNVLIACLASSYGLVAHNSLLKLIPSLTVSITDELTSIITLLFVTAALDYSLTPIFFFFFASKWETVKAIITISYLQIVGNSGLWWAAILCWSSSWAQKQACINDSRFFFSPISVEAPNSFETRGSQFFKTMAAESKNLWALFLCLSKTFHQSTY